MTGLKTNKSYSKRFKITKNGKVMQRRPNQNHFRAKKARKIQLRGKRMDIFPVTARDLRHYLPKA